jgi:hypothetical protein
MGGTAPRGILDNQFIPAALSRRNRLEEKNSEWSAETDRRHWSATA